MTAPRQRRRAQVQSRYRFNSERAQAQASIMQAEKDTTKVRSVQRAVRGAGMARPTSRQSL
eukprot:290594-Lingulodinium_polyedra.AAC.1